MRRGLAALSWLSSTGWIKSLPEPYGTGRLAMLYVTNNRPNWDSQM